MLQINNNLNVPMKIETYRKSVKMTKLSSTCLKFLNMVLKWFSVSLNKSVSYASLEDDINNFPSHPNNTWKISNVSHVGYFVSLMERKV